MLPLQYMGDTGYMLLEEKRLKLSDNLNQN